MNRFVYTSMLCAYYHKVRYIYIFLKINSKIYISLLCLAQFYERF